MGLPLVPRGWSIPLPKHLGVLPSNQKEQGHDLAPFFLTCGSSPSFFTSIRCVNLLSLAQAVPSPSMRLRLGKLGTT